MVGVDPLDAHDVAGPRSGAALTALEAAVLTGLLRPPCLVTFSGGTDSSLVLAVATRVARRHGLPDPVPFSWCFPNIPAADEGDQQRRVLDALGLRERLACRPGPDELDFVGPQAQQVLADHGVRHPVNLHLHARPALLARGGSLLTGAGGDQVLSGWLRPENRRLVRCLKDRLPASLRVAARRLPERELPWLRPAVAALVLQARMEEEAAEPVMLGDRVRWHAGRRDLRLSLTNLHRLGAASDVTVLSPLADPRFVHAVAHEFGDRPAPRRAALVAMLAGDAVPEVVWRSRRKARFGDVFLGEHSRALVSGWDGEGVDPSVVDVPGLRQVWGQWPVPLATAGLMQQVLLARDDGPGPSTNPPAEGGLA